MKSVKIRPKIWIGLVQIKQNLMKKVVGNDPNLSFCALSNYSEKEFMESSIFKGTLLLQSQAIWAYFWKFGLFWSQNWPKWGWNSYILVKIWPTYHCWTLSHGPVTFISSFWAWITSSAQNSGWKWTNNHDLISDFILNKIGYLHLKLCKNKKSLCINQ